jgi:hypothetical protein
MAMKGLTGILRKRGGTLIINLLKNAGPRNKSARGETGISGRKGWGGDLHTVIEVCGFKGF